MDINEDLANNFFSDELIKLIALSYKVEKDHSLHKVIYNYLTPKQKITFLNTFIENKIEFDISDFNINIEEVYSFVTNNIGKLLPLFIYTTNISEVFKCDDYLKETVNVYYYNHKEIIIESLMNDERLSIYNDGIKELIELIIRDIAYNENALATDFKWLTSGSYSHVLKIKDKILKIGNNRMNKTFPNNPLILKPLLRKTFNIDNQEVFIEVTEEVAMGNICSEKIYELYVKFRKLGLICIDLHYSNVGRLKKPNKRYWKRELNPTDNMLELEPYINGEELTEGEVVLTDADGIFREDDERLNEYKLQAWAVKEARYQKELKEGKIR